MEDVLGIMNKVITIETIKPISLAPVGYIDTFTVDEKNYESIEKAFLSDGSIIIKQIDNVRLL